MSTPNITHITSRDNTLLKELRKLSTDSTAYRKQGQVWLEGDHLCRAAIERGVQPVMAVFLESFWPQASEYIAYDAIKNIAKSNTDTYNYANSAEHREGIQAFIDKRKPNWTTD